MIGFPKGFKLWKRPLSRWSTETFPLSLSLSLIRSAFSPSQNDEDDERKRGEIVERANEGRSHIVAECTTERAQLLPIQMQIPLNDGKDALKNALMQDEVAQWYTDFTSGNVRFYYKLYVSSFI